MLIDAGGARMREQEDWDSEADRRAKGRPVSIPGFRVSSMAKEATVTVHVIETHDGEACDCIEQDMTLRVGQEVELTHVCHDGRVDKVVARVTAINTGPEHGKAEVKAGVDTGAKRA